VQSAEGGATSETDPVTATSSSPVATIAGQVDVSQQLFDRANPPIDVVIAEELGAAWGEDFDQQVINGQGASGQLDGFLHLAGTTSITATTITAVANIAAAARLRGDVSTAFGQAPDTLILHPRRAAWICSTLGYGPVPWPEENIIEAPGDADHA
jgi:HK97 family phage major capsid protein